VAERQRLVARLLLGARVLLVVVGVSPWLLPFARRYLPAEPVWRLLDWCFDGVCHRMLSRTLTLASLPMPLCSRCAGIFAGLALGALVPWPRLELRRARWALGASGVLMVLDVLAQDLGLHPFWHWTRLLTGVLLGHFGARLLVAAIERGRADKPDEPQPEQGGVS
jgi:uncharacterized membrane protein